MKYLKIENNKGFYRIDDANEVWLELDQINKDHLLKVLQLAIEKEFEMDEYKEELLQNPAHNIIYKNIYTKFSEFLKNKNRFRDTAEATYKAALEKYKMTE